MGATKAEIAGRVGRALGGDPRVAAALVFGSHVRGRAREDSDVDVAVLLDRGPAPGERASVIRELVAALAREVAADRIDLVLLNDAPPVLAFQVLKHGEVALCRDEVALHRFKVATYRRHADREPTERFFREVTKRRLRGGSDG